MKARTPNAMQVVVQSQLTSSFPFPSLSLIHRNPKHHLKLRLSQIYSTAAHLSPSHPRHHS